MPTILRKYEKQNKAGHDHGIIIPPVGESRPVRRELFGPVFSEGRTEQMKYSIMKCTELARGTSLIVPQTNGPSELWSFSKILTHLETKMTSSKLKKKVLN